MESNRFQICHPLNMVLQQVPVGDEFQCSGCQLPGSGSAYVCSQCKVFLHEHCFRSSCSTDLLTNPLAPTPSNPLGSVAVDYHNLAITELSLNLSKMQLDLRIRGACIPKSTTPPSGSGVECTDDQAPSHPNPAQICVPNTDDVMIEKKRIKHEDFLLKHKSHPEHLLKLVIHPPYAQKKFTCAACGETGTDAAYCCEPCNYYLHIGCESVPDLLPTPSHKHPVTLRYSYTASSSTCDVCKLKIPKQQWTYYCSPCNWGTHLKCIFGKTDAYIA